MLVTAIVTGIRDFIKSRGDVRKISVEKFFILIICLMLVTLFGIFYNYRNIQVSLPVILPLILVLSIALFGLVMFVITVVKGIRDLVKARKKPDTEKD